MADNFETPQSRNEALLQDILGAENPIGEPQSRNEAILTAILEGLDEIPAPYVDPPQSRIEELLVELWKNGGGGSATLIEKSITENGDYDASDDDADGYSVVHVSVPAPENKFKSLVDRTIQTVTADDLQGVTVIGDYRFYECTALTSVEVPNGVTSVGRACFQESGRLVSVTFPSSGFTAIGNYAFYFCRSISNIVLPASITTIGNHAFAYCDGAQYIKILATTPPTLDNADAFNNTNCPIYVPAESVTAYQQATNWSAVASRIQAIPTT